MRRGKIFISPTNHEVFCKHESKHSIRTKVYAKNYIHLVTTSLGELQQVWQWRIAEFELDFVDSSQELLFVSS